MIERLTNEAFVEWCFQRFLGRNGDPEGQAYFLQQLARGASRLAVVEAFVASAERQQPQTDDAAYVAWAFEAILGREVAPDDQAAYTEALRSSISRRELLETLINAPEFRERVALHSSYRWVPPGHFYSPIPSDEDLAAHRDFDWNPAEIPGVDLRAAAQMQLVEQFVPFYNTMPFGAEARPGLRYRFRNPSYSYADGIFLHCMLRHVRPQRVIEIGSGNSSCMILDTNQHFFRNAIQCTFIEPYPAYLESLLQPTDRVNIVPTRLQDVPLELFDQLEANDILLVDSTHVSRLNSDVNRILFAILPRLKPGVRIHFHDVFYPFEYAVEWLERGWAWNEQYVLRAFLQYNGRFLIDLFSTYLMRFQRPWFEQHMPDCLKDTGGCIWLQKV
jgi:hypothetical protein